jgi:molybdopterin-guanine dinucleotide biosynthesis protein A
MGGVDKARLPAPDSGEALLERLLRLGQGLGLDCVVVGGQAPTGIAQLDDEPAGVGPIGGLSALLAYAGECPALALACDLPFVTGPLLARLAQDACLAAVLCPRDPASGKWQPLFARYDPPRVLPALRVAVASGVRSFQTFLRTIEVAELALAEHERAQLADWDAPSDVRPARPDPESR